MFKKINAVKDVCADGISKRRVSLTFNQEVKKEGERLFLEIENFYDISYIYFYYISVIFIIFYYYLNASIIPFLLHIPCCVKKIVDATCLKVDATSFVPNGG